MNIYLKIALWIFAFSAYAWASNDDYVTRCDVEKKQCQR